ncbi:TPA: hypothetical protein JLA97_004023 [Escherichia coli]|nr:hypothetical protein [Escherichia coli]
MANELTLTVPKEVLDKAYADSVKELAGVLGIENEFNVQLQFLKDTLQIKENREAGGGAPLALAIIYAGLILKSGDEL